MNGSDNLSIYVLAPQLLQAASVLNLQSMVTWFCGFFPPATYEKALGPREL